ncbi:hypothetical protein [Alienimonas sp. DA493]|uniref:hypothetical protein n=1 Tax=Alienimonas sp. DA493 TaxID=3373605 RepID=UPI003754CB92
MSRSEHLVRIADGPEVVVSAHAYKRYSERHGGEPADLRDSLALAEPAQDWLVAASFVKPPSELWWLGPVGFVLNPDRKGEFPVVATVLDLTGAIRWHFRQSKGEASRV